MAIRPRELALRILMHCGLYPHVAFTYSPFKIVEFEELLAPIHWRGDERVLDIGCGAGLQTMLIARHAGHTTGLDIESAFIADARRRASHARIRGTIDFDDRHLHMIQYPDATFDHIFSVCVLEHIPEHEDILRECLRILKPGGQIHFSVDSLEPITAPALVASHTAQHKVVHYYRPDELRHTLESIGFGGVSVHPIFRSAFAKRYFEEGIRRGFNFGRIRASVLASSLRKAEAKPDVSGPGIFLLARARRIP